MQKKLQCKMQQLLTFGGNAFKAVMHLNAFKYIAKHLPLEMHWPNLTECRAGVCGVDGASVLEMRQ